MGHGLLLLASVIFLCCSFTISSNLSLSFCLVPSQSSSDDQSDSTGDKSGAGVDGLLGVASSLGTAGTSEMPGRLEGTDRLAVVMMAMVVGHIDTAVEGSKCPISNFMYFPLSWDLLLLLLVLPK